MTQREQEFETAIASTLEAIKELILIKGKEYRRNNNPFHTFERGAQMTNLTREEVLQGFLRKHLISVEDMRNDSCLGITQTTEKINEKYNDILVYFLIEKAMMLENAGAYENSLAKAKGVLAEINSFNAADIFTRDA